MEKQNNIILAPSSSQVTELYKLWRENHAGRLSDFYKFLTSPTDQRDRFLSGLENKSEFNEYSSLTPLNYEFDSKHRPTENAFTRNPVYLSVETTSMVTYNIMHCLNFEYRRSLFTGNGNGSFKVNIAEVLETVFEDIPRFKWK